MAEQENTKQLHIPFLRVLVLEIQYSPIYCFSIVPAPLTFTANTIGCRTPITGTVYEYILYPGSLERWSA
jgi:hypothetical protein